MLDITIIKTILTQGIFEAFPVSSSMHVFLLNLPKNIAASMHFGSSFAFILILKNYIFNVLKKFDLKIIARGTILIIPTVIIGFLVKNYAFNLSIKTVSLINILASLLMFFSLKVPGEKSINKLNFLECLIIGILISSALIQGVSRFGVTFTVLRFFKIRKIDSLVWALLTGIPITLGAALINLPNLEIFAFSLIAGLITYFCLIITFKMLNHWKYFSIYRILISLIILFKTLK